MISKPKAAIALTVGLGIVGSAALYMQADVKVKFDLTTTLLDSLAPTDPATGEYASTFDSVDAIYDWIDETFLSCPRTSAPSRS